MKKQSATKSTSEILKAIKNLDKNDTKDSSCKLPQLSGGSKNNTKWKEKQKDKL